MSWNNSREYSRMGLMTFWLLAILLPSLVAAGCGCVDTGKGDDDDNASPEEIVQKPFGSWTKDTLFQFQTVDSSGTATSILPGAFVGEKEVAGETLLDFQYGSEDNPSAGLVHLYFKAPDLTTYTLGGFEYAGVVSATADEPWTVSLDMPLNEEQTVSVSGSITVSGGSPLNGTAEGTYLLAENNAAVDTGMGAIHGCNHFQGQLTGLTGDGIPSFAADLPGLDGELWFHKDYGPVGGVVTQLGVGFGLLGEEEYGSATSGFNSIKKMAIVSPDNPDFMLSTFDVNGKYDADRFTHAYVYMELRWADEDKAKTDEMPGFQPSPYGFPLNPQIGTLNPSTGDGYFIYTLEQSPVSLFHPEENGNGYVYWAALVSEAAKNETGPAGIAYKVHVTRDDFLAGALRVTARIYYKLTSDIGG